MFEYVVLSVAFLVFLSSWYFPLPYGRFSDDYAFADKIIPNRWFIAFASLPALVLMTIVIAIATRSNPLDNFGTVVFVFLWMHFLMRSIIVPFAIGFIYTSDPKKVSAMLLLLVMVYNAFVGYTLGHMCTTLKGTFGASWTDIPLLTGALACLVLNIYYDIRVNYLRCHGEDDVCKNLYVSRKTLEKEFTLLFALEITSPNYFFEILEWGFIFLLTWHTESFAYFVASVLILWTRGLYINLTYDN